MGVLVLGAGIVGSAAVWDMRRRGHEVTIGDVDSDTLDRLGSGVSDIEWVTGGDTRQDSVRAGLEALADRAPEKVLIHDAARPDLPFAVVERLISALDAHSGAIPTLPVVDPDVTLGEQMLAAARSAGLVQPDPIADFAIDELDAESLLDRVPRPMSRGERQLCAQRP